MTSIYVNWGGGNVKLTWNKNLFPSRDLITSVHGFCFYEGKLLLVNLEHRGWDFPGGHIEPGETPEQCLKREAMEEGYVEGKSTFIGSIIVDHHENPNWDPSSPYPLVGYQLFYRMDITKLYPFDAKFESHGRIFVNPNELENYRETNKIYQAILNDAMKLEVRS